MRNHRGQPQIINGAISSVIEKMISSVAEAEVGALFMNGKEILPLRISCEAYE
jgi:hypothetical protein